MARRDLIGDTEGERAYGNWKLGHRLIWPTFTIHHIGLIACTARGLWFGFDERLVEAMGVFSGGIIFLMATVWAGRAAQAGMDTFRRQDREATK